MKSEETRALIAKLARISKMLHMADNKKIHGCNHVEFLMMNCIRMRSQELEESNSELPGVSVSTIATYLKCSKPAISKMLNNLEEKGYVQRLTTKTDRRAVYIVMTEKGQKKHAEIEEYIDEYFNDILTRLGEDDTEELLRIMGRFYEVLKEKEQEREE